MHTTYKFISEIEGNLVPGHTQIVGASRGCDRRALDNISKHEEQRLWRSWNLTPGREIAHVCGDGVRPSRHGRSRAVALRGGSRPASRARANIRHDLSNLPVHRSCLPHLLSSFTEQFRDNCPWVRSLFTRSSWYSWAFYFYSKTSIVIVVSYSPNYPLFSWGWFLKFSFFVWRR